MKMICPLNGNCKTQENYSNNPEDFCSHCQPHEFDEESCDCCYDSDGEKIDGSKCVPFDLRYYMKRVLRE